MMITLDILREFKTLNGLRVAVLLEDHPEGLTAKEIGERLGMPKASAYRAIEENIAGGKILKNETTLVSNLRPILKNETENPDFLKNETTLVSNLRPILKNETDFLKNETENADFLKFETEKESKEKDVFPHTPNLEKENKEKADYPPPPIPARARPDDEGGGGGGGREEEIILKSDEEKIIDTILDSTAQLERLFMSTGLPPQSDLKAYFRPHARRFVDELIMRGEDPFLVAGEAYRTKIRFSYWFQKHYNDDETAKNSGGGRRNSYGGGQLTAEQIEDQQHAKEARMKNSADLDQEYDAQQAAALTPGALSAKEAFFKAWDARMGRKREEDGAASGGSGDGRERRAEEGIGNPRIL